MKSKITSEIAELIGLMAGDGCLSLDGKAKRIYISGHKKDDLKYHQQTTKKLFKKIFNKEVNIQFKKHENTLFIRFSDKRIFKELAKYLPIGKKYENLQIPNQILKNKKNLFAFTRGLSDTDGCIVFSKQHRDYPYYPRIEITSKSQSLLQTLLSELKKNGFYGSVSHKGKQSFRLEFPGNKNLDRWLKIIGFNNKKHLKKIEGRNSDLQRPRADLNCRPCG